MKVINSKVAEWKPEDVGILTPEGYLIEGKQRADLCRYCGIPETLSVIDRKYGTDTVLTVLNQTNNKEVKLLVEDDKLFSVIDPKSCFVNDTEFEVVAGKIAKAGVKESKRSSFMGTTKVVYDIDMQKSDVFMSDVFTKQIAVTRLAQGGIHLSLDLLRQACTNGSKVADSKYSLLMRNGRTSASMNSRVRDIIDMELNKYLESLWSNKGHLIEASVGDYYSMANTLAKIVSEDVADEYFQKAPIDLFYLQQGIDVEHMNNELRQRLPSGISYYDAFNILTNGVKKAKNLSFADEIGVAQYLAAYKLKQRKDADFAFKGKPEFDSTRIKILMGDKVA